MIKEIWIEENILLEELDRLELGKLFPRLDEDDHILNVKINPVGICFILGNDSDKEEAQR